MWQRRHVTPVGSRRRIPSALVSGVRNGACVRSSGFSGLYLFSCTFVCPADGGGSCTCTDATRRENLVHKMRGDGAQTGLALKTILSHSICGKYLRVIVFADARVAVSGAALAARYLATFVNCLASFVNCAGKYRHDIMICNRE